MSWTPERLIEFEQRIADVFNAGDIRAPVHLAGGNEAQLIHIFKYVQSDDWVCGAWRMHYHCLLKGVDPVTLERDIRAGRSITLCYPEHRIITSAIVGGIIPIALGIAWSIKHNGGSNQVWCFVGDMTACGGMFHECRQYAAGFELPIVFVREGNGKSVNTRTPEAWGCEYILPMGEFDYDYILGWPHAGTGKWVSFDGR